MKITEKFELQIVKLYSEKFILTNLYLLIRSNTSPVYNLIINFILTAFYWIPITQCAGFSIFKVGIPSSFLESTLFILLVHLSQNDPLIAQFLLYI